MTPQDKEEHRLLSERCAKAMQQLAEAFKGASYSLDAFAKAGRAMEREGK